MTQKSEHDFRNSIWGHSLNILHWDTDAHLGRAACWTSSPVKDGDVVIVKSQRGSMRLVVSDVEWQSNVDDMYIFNIAPEAVEENPVEEELWVTKVRRSTGGSSIIDVVSSKEKAQSLADEFNLQFQTDAYYIQKYDEKLHAYSRHR